MDSATKRGFSQALLAIGICLLSFAGAAQGWAGETAGPATHPPPSLSKLSQVLSLAPEELRKGHPFRASLEVTYADPGYSLLFAQDESGGVYLETRGEFPKVCPGSAIEVQGLARKGLYAPYLEVTNLRVTGEKPLSRPQHVSLDRVLNGSLDSQPVEIAGVVRSERASGGRLHLELAEGLNRVHVELLQTTNRQAPALLDHLVGVRGVAASRLEKNQVVRDFRVLASGFSDVTVLEPPPRESLQGQPIAISDLKNHWVRRHALHRVRVRGVVTGFWPGMALFIQDASGALLIQTSLEGGLQPGDVVEALGFLAPALEPPCLEDSSVTKVGAAGPCQPAPISAEQAEKGHYDQTLVSIEGVILHQRQWSSNLLTLALRSGSRPLTAILRAQGGPELKRLPAGSQVRLSGVCLRAWGSGSSESELRLWLRSPADVEVLALAPTPPGGNASQAILGGALLASLMLGALLWLNWRHRQRTERILATQGELQLEIQRNEAQLQRSAQERERIAQDLHDDIIQSIYAAGLGLENARRKVRQAPEHTESVLARSIEILNEVMGKVRSYIAGLEPKILSGSEFKTALKSLAVTAGDSRTQFAIDVDTVAANLLTPPEALQLLNVAKEAISNSLRHAQASRVTVSLRPEGPGLRLEIQDDGVGFDPLKTEPRGLGLRNMAFRAAALRGQLEIISSPGTGCSIIARVPKQMSNDSH
jgi:signal transduction histidine kinase